MKPQILCISFSDINADSRVLRQLHLLAEFGEVTTLSYGDQPDDATTHLEIDSALPSLPQTLLGVAKLATRQFKASELAAPAVKRGLELAAGRPFDIIVANEARALPLAHKLSALLGGQIPVWGDMHEWAPEERVHVLSWRLLVKPYMTHVCREYLPVTSAVTAVNASIGKLYEQAFGCQTETVRNASAYQELSPSPMADNLIRLVHSGAAVPGRNLEGMIEAAISLGPGYTLDLYLVKARDGGKYWDTLKAVAAGSNSVTFHDAVPPADLSSTMNKYDIGIFSLPPRTTNHKLMLPNKFFDFLQARLAIVFSPSPETSTLIEKHGLGRITGDFSAESLKDAVKSLSREEIQQCKNNSDKAASILSSAEDENTERTIMRRLLSVQA